MKVAYVGTLLPETNYFKYLAQSIQENGQELLVYADKEPKNLTVGLKDVFLVWDKSPKFFFQIIRKSLKDKPKIIHLHHEIGMFGNLKGAVMFPFLLILLRFLGFKLVVTIHAVVKKEKINLDFLEINKFPVYPALVFPTRTFFTFLNKTIGIVSSRIIVHSEGLKKILIKDYRLKAEKIVVIPHGVPDKVEENVKEPIDSAWWPKIRGHKFCLYFGYLHRRKGLEQVIKGLNLLKLSTKYPLPTLIIAGGTLQKDYEESLKKLVVDLDLAEDIIFAGFVSGDELSWLLTNCVFVVAPATYSISASGPLAQVIAFEKPVILTKIGVFAEELEDGKSALYVQPENPAGWEEAIKIMEKDDNLRKELTKGIKEIHEERKWQKIGQRTVEIYQSVV